MLVKLPNGLVESGEHFSVVEIGELTGKEQNYLADKELIVGNIGHIPKILSNLVYNLQTAQGMKYKDKSEDFIWKLPNGDLETILIKIRENTYGPRFYHQGECTHCGHMNKNLRLDLDTLEIKYLTKEELETSKVLTLPKSQIEVELRTVMLKDLFDMLKLANGKQDELITSVLAMSLKRIGSNSKVTAKDVEVLKMSDIQFLQEQTDLITLEGTIDTNIEITCSSCHKDFSIKLNAYDPSFFVPTKG